jgi:hypothetical protein
VAGGLAYVADGASGLQVLEISDPRAPRIIGSAAVSGEAVAVAATGDMVFLIEDCGRSADPAKRCNRRLRIFDVSDPRNPRQVGILEVPSDVFRIDAGEGMVFLASLRQGLQIIDVGNPKKPELRGTATLPWPQQAFATAVDVFAESGKVFVANGRAGVQVFDISNPGEPKILGSIRVSDYAKDISLVGERAYVLDTGQGLQVIDVSDPGNMRIVGGLSLPADVRSFAIAGGMLHVENGNGGVLVLPLPIELEKPVILSSDRMTVVVPSPPFPGDYILQVFNRREARELPGVLTFTAP